MQTKTTTSRLLSSVTVLVFMMSLGGHSLVVAYNEKHYLFGAFERLNEYLVCNIASEEPHDNLNWSLMTKLKAGYKLDEDAIRAYFIIGTLAKAKDNCGEIVAEALQLVHDGSEASKIEPSSRAGRVARYFALEAAHKCRPKFEADYLKAIQTKLRSKCKLKLILTKQFIDEHYSTGINRPEELVKPLIEVLKSESLKRDEDFNEFLENYPNASDSERLNYLNNYYIQQPCVYLKNSLDEPRAVVELFEQYDNKGETNADLAKMLQTSDEFRYLQYRLQFCNYVRKNPKLFQNKLEEEYRHN